MGNAVRREKAAAKKQAALQQSGPRGPMKKGTFLAQLAAKSPKSKQEDPKDQSVQEKEAPEEEKKSAKAPSKEEAPSPAVKEKGPEAKDEKKKKKKERDPEDVDGKKEEEEKEKTDVEKEEEEEAVEAQEKEESEDREKSKNEQAPQTPKDKEEEAPLPDEKILQRESKKLLYKLRRLGKQKRLNKRRAWKMMQAITEIWEAYISQGLKPETRIVRKQAAEMIKLTKQPLQHWFDRPMKTGKVTKRTLKKTKMYLKRPTFIGKNDKTASDPK